MENTETKTFVLPKEKVLVVPVRRKGSWLPDNHEASFLFGNSYVSLTVAMDRATGELVDPLTEDERNYFESDAAGLALKKGDLSIYKKEDNYWKKFRVKLDKNVLELDLSNPKQYIQYKVLLTNKEIVAPSADEKFEKGTYRYAVTKHGYQNEEKVKAASNKKDAYRFFGKIDSSVSKMKDFLTMYYTMKPGGKQVAPDASQDFCIAEIEKIIEGDLRGFLKIAKDADYEKKVFVTKALRARALERNGLTFQTPEGTVIGDTMQDVIAYFDNPANNEELLKAQSRVENNQ